jgi:ankyrin repeat protein
MLFSRLMDYTDCAKRWLAKMVEAVKRNDIDMVELLRVKTYSDIDSLFVVAIEHGNLQIAEYFYNLGCCPNAKDDYAMRIAASNGHLAMIKYLIDIDCDPNCLDAYPLRVSSQNGHLNIVEYIVNLGLCTQDQYNSALICAADNGQADVVKYLVSVGANPKQTNTGVYGSEYDSLAYSHQNGQHKIHDYLYLLLSKKDIQAYDYYYGSTNVSYDMITPKHLKKYNLLKFVLKPTSMAMQLSYL